MCLCIWASQACVCRSSLPPGAGAEHKKAPFGDREGNIVAQTIEAYVGRALDDAKISPLHQKVIALIAAGYFFDVVDFTIFGSLVPYILTSKFATGPEVA